MRKFILLLIVLAGLGYGGYTLYKQRSAPMQDSGTLTLYGNVDIREVELAFKDVERIKNMYVDEGDAVKKGQVLAELETRRLREEIAASKAGVAAQSFVVQRLENGSRPEEIGTAEAQVQQARAELIIAERTYERQARLLVTGATPQQDVDDALAARDVARAKLNVALKQLELVQIGPRWEDISEAQATLHSQEAGLAQLKVTLEESKLRAPLDAIVRNRNLEPGDMASAQKPVFTLAIVNPKWIRTYVSETELGRLRLGMEGYAGIDARPDKKYAGSVGFISPVAEFTPRTVETPELRTSLVYEVRFIVRDPDNDLRLGTPATVILELEKPSAHAPRPTPETRQPAE